MVPGRGEAKPLLLWSHWGDKMHVHETLGGRDEV